MTLMGESLGRVPQIVHTVGIGLLQYYVFYYFETKLHADYC